MATAAGRGSRLTERLWVGIWRVSFYAVLRLPDLVTINPVTIWTLYFKACQCERTLCPLMELDMIHFELNTKLC